MAREVAATEAGVSLGGEPEGLLFLRLLIPVTPAQVPDSVATDSDSA